MVEIKSTDKLQKLIPRLATTHDGEIVATVRAIQRVLEVENLSFHDLAERVAAPALPQPKQGTTRETWEEKVAYCVTESHRLNEWEYDFILSMTQWDEPTAKQKKVINKIYKKLVMK